MLVLLCCATDYMTSRHRSIRSRRVLMTSSSRFAAHNSPRVLTSRWMRSRTSLPVTWQYPSRRTGSRRRYVLIGVARQDNIRWRHASAAASAIIINSSTLTSAAAAAAGALLSINCAFTSTSSYHPVLTVLRNIPRNALPFYLLFIFNHRNKIFGSKPSNTYPVRDISHSVMFLLPKIKRKKIRMKSAITIYYTLFSRPYLINGRAIGMVVVVCLSVVCL